ncbi:MAG: nucleotidyltransferase domain-containing protein [Thermomicrobiales bacterium]|nr:nucleotidyltransferase domain-containing protein [Thermomicrobiales bacterium]
MTETSLAPPSVTEPLPEIVAAHLDELRALCREFGVTRLEVFGSVVTSRFDPETSDVDFLVEYPPDHDLGPWAGRHTELEARLANVMERPVDLVMAEAIRRPRFLEAIRPTRRLLYVV